MSGASKPTSWPSLRIRLVVSDVVLTITSIALLTTERPDWFWWPLTTDWWWLGSAILAAVGAAAGFLLWLGQMLGLEEREHGL